MRRALALVVAAAAAVTAGCKGAPPPAPPKAPAPVAAAVAPKPGRYAVDRARARFDVYGAGTIAGHYRLRFREWSATVVVGDDAKATLDVEIDTRSVEVDKSAALGIVREHLLEVDRYPRATLTATLAPTDAAGGYAIDGVAELHGVRRPLRFVGRLSEAADGYTFRSEVRVSRKDFGIRYTPIEPLVKDEVKIVVDALVRALPSAPDAPAAPPAAPDVVL